MGNFFYDERLKILNIDRIEIRRIKFDLVLFCKIINNLVDMDTYDFLNFQILRSWVINLNLEWNLQKIISFLSVSVIDLVHI